MPWFKVYECSNANDIFNMFVYLLSSAVEKHAPLKLFLKKRILKLFKETWFDEECKSLQREHQTTYENLFEFITRKQVTIQQASKEIV